MILNGIFGGLAVLSFALTVWQWLAARRFPLHRRMLANSPTCAVTLLKPLKGCDEHTEKCLRSWFAQDYPGEMQILLAVDHPSDPVCAVARKIIAEYPQHDAQLVICLERTGANAKVSKLAQLEPLARHEILVISDADVHAPTDLLAKLTAQLGNDKVGLVNCFYRFANPTTRAMHWEAIAINVDFWSQVLQSQSLKPLDFALGAVMATRRRHLSEIGGYGGLANYLADDYELGHRIVKQGWRIELSAVVVECWSAPMTWPEVWRHQLRWARTIRACQPVPYFFSILANGTLWPLLWLLVAVVVSGQLIHSEINRADGIGSMTAMSKGVLLSIAVSLIFLTTRVVLANALHRRLARRGIGWAATVLVPMKDLLHSLIWVAAFTGNRIEWRGEWHRLRRDGTLKKD